MRRLNTFNFKPDSALIFIVIDSFCNSDNRGGGVGVGLAFGIFVGISGNFLFLLAFSALGMIAEGVRSTKRSTKGLLRATGFEISIF